jgi:hypothetical protein
MASLKHGDHIPRLGRAEAEPAPMVALPLAHDLIYSFLTLLPDLPDFLHSHPIPPPDTDCIKS